MAQEKGSMSVKEFEVVDILVDVILSVIGGGIGRDQNV